MYLNDSIIFILPRTVVCIEMDDGRMTTMVAQIVVDHAYYCIGSLPRVE